MTSIQNKVTVMGTTSWGITLACLLANNNIPVDIWTRTEIEAQSIQNDREDKRHLPGITLPKNITINHNLESCMKNSKYILLAVPSHSFRDNMINLISYLNDNQIIISATKGIEIKTNKRMSEVAAEYISYKQNNTFSVLSGPNLAKEIANGLPASSVIASLSNETAQDIQNILTTKTFRIYRSSDVTGIELCGSLKNIIAIGAGIVDGLNFGNNAKSALVTRGLAEIKRFAMAYNAQETTFYGLAGIGDLMTTISSDYSRNRYVGEQLAMGNNIDSITNNMTNIAEGINTTKAIYSISQSKNIEMPITSMVYQIIFENLPPMDAFSALMDRELTAE